MVKNFHFVLLFLVIFNFNFGTLAALGDDGDEGSAPRLVQALHYADDPTVDKRQESVIPHPDSWARYFRIHGMPKLRVKTEEDGTQHVKYRAKSKSADTVHTATTLWWTYSLVEKTLATMMEDPGMDATLRGRIETLLEEYKSAPPADVFPHGFEDEEMWNAYYDPSYHEVVMGWLINSTTGKKEYLCRSGDILSHEAGHDALGRLWWNLFTYGGAEPGGFHEGFGDTISAMTRLLQNPHGRAEAAVDARGDLHMAEHLRELAEGFGKAIGEKYGGETETGLRDMGEDIGLPNRLTEKGMKRATREVHDYGHAWASAGFDVLSAAYTARRTHVGLLGVPDSMLHEVADNLWRIQLAAIATGKHLSGIPSFSGIATEMWRNAGKMSNVGGVPWQALIKEHFERHGIAVKSTGAAFGKGGAKRTAKSFPVNKAKRVSQTMPHIAALQRAQKGSFQRDAAAKKRSKGKQSWGIRAQTSRPRSVPIT